MALANDVKINSYPPKGKIQELDPAFVKWLQDNWDWVLNMQKNMQALDARITALGG